MRRSRCFVLDQQLRVCEVLTLSKPKRTVTPFLHVLYPPQAQWAFVEGYLSQIYKNFYYATTIILFYEKGKNKPLVAIFGMTNVDK